MLLAKFGGAMNDGVPIALAEVKGSGCGYL